MGLRDRWTSGVGFKAQSHQCVGYLLLPQTQDLTERVIYYTHALVGLLDVGQADSHWGDSGLPLGLSWDLKVRLGPFGHFHQHTKQIS